MKKIGSLLVTKEKSLKDEKIIWSFHAAHVQCKARLVKGKLYLTNKRLIFCASYFDRISEGKCWNTRVEDIKNIETQTLEEDIFVRGSKEKMKIVLNNHEFELFTVKNLQFIIKKLNKTLSRIK